MCRVEHGLTRSDDTASSSKAISTPGRLPSIGLSSYQPAGPSPSVVAEFKDGKRGRESMYSGTNIKKHNKYSVFRYIIIYI